MTIFVSSAPPCNSFEVKISFADKSFLKAAVQNPCLMWTFYILLQNLSGSRGGSNFAFILPSLMLTSS